MALQPPTSNKSQRLHARIVYVMLSCCRILYT